MGLYKMIYNHYCSSHGVQCGVENSFIQLPDNVAVILNCHNTAIKTNTESLEKEIVFCMSDELRDLQKLHGLTHEHILELMKIYFSKLSDTFNILGNEFCVYVDECPNLFLAIDNIQPGEKTKIFRTGIYTLPFEVIHQYDGKTTSLNQKLKEYMILLNQNQVSYYQYTQYSNITSLYAPNISRLNLFNYPLFKYFMKPLSKTNTYDKEFASTNYQVTSKYGISKDENEWKNKKLDYLINKIQTQFNPSKQNFIQKLVNQENVVKQDPFHFHVIIVNACANGKETFRNLKKGSLREKDNFEFVFFEKFKKWLRIYISQKCKVDVIEDQNCCLKPQSIKALRDSFNVPCTQQENQQTYTQIYNKLAQEQLKLWSFLNQVNQNHTTEDNIKVVFDLIKTHESHLMIYKTMINTTPIYKGLDNLKREANMVYTNFKEAQDKVQKVEQVFNDIKQTEELLSHIILFFESFKDKT